MEGLFIIEIKDKHNTIDEVKQMIEKINIHMLYTQYANVVYLLFKNSYDKIVKKHRLQISLMNLYEIVGDESIVVQKNGKTWEINSMKSDAYGKVSYNSFCWFPREFNIIGSSKIEKEIFKEIMDDFEKNLNKVVNDKNILQILLLIQKSYITMIDEQNDISILLSWISTERIINNMWEDLLEEKVTKNRKKQILEIKEYTVNVKTNELLLNGKISNELASKIDNVRKNRNKIMHGDYNMFETTGKLNGKYEKI